MVPGLLTPDHPAVGGDPAGRPHPARRKELDFFPRFERHVLVSVGGFHGKVADPHPLEDGKGDFDSSIPQRPHLAVKIREPAHFFLFTMRMTSLFFRPAFSAGLSGLTRVTITRPWVSSE